MDRSQSYRLDEYWSYYRHFLSPRSCKSYAEVWMMKKISNLHLSFQILKAQTFRFDWPNLH